MIGYNVFIRVFTNLAPGVGLAKPAKKRPFYPIGSLLTTLLVGAACAMRRFHSLTVEENGGESPKHYLATHYFLILISKSCFVTQNVLLTISENDRKTLIHREFWCDMEQRPLLRWRFDFDL